MTLLLHRFAALVAILCVAIFFSATLLVELFGDTTTIATVKSLIISPGLFILVTSIALTGGSGFALARSRNGKLTQLKKRRMPIIGANGIVVLIPCAILLDQWASAGMLGTHFYIVQSIELLAGGINIILMAMNIRDGRRIHTKLGVRPMFERL